LITWSSKRQPTISQSLTKSKYRALSNRAQKAIWLRT
jgi:hypothetical protein